MARNRQGKVRSATRLVAAMATMSRQHWRDGRTGSLFAFEGVFIAQLRAHLCLAHWPWDAADRAARDTVGEALRRAGAMRPSVDEAQYSYGSKDIILRKEMCATCGGEVPGHRRKFCCTPCYNASRRSEAWVKTAHDRQTCETPAPHLDEIPPEDTCDYCDKALSSVAHNRKYCDLDCRDKHRADLRKNEVRHVHCENCGDAFETTDPRKASCTPACAKAAYKKRKRAAA